jgi:WD40 repeat protein
MKLRLHLTIAFLLLFMALTNFLPNELLAQSKIIATFTDPDGESFVKAVVSSDGSMIAGSTNYKTIVWDIETQEIINTYSGITQAVCLDFSPNNQYIVSGGLSLKADVRDIQTGEAVLKIQHDLDDYNYTSPMSQVKFTSDGKYLLVSGSPKFEMWDIESKSIYRELTTSIPLAGNHFYLLRDPSLLLFNEMIKEIYPETGESSSVYTLSIYDIDTGERVRFIEKNVRFQSISHNKRFIAYYDETISDVSNYDIVIYDLEESHEISRATKSNTIQAPHKNLCIESIE